MRAGYIHWQGWHFCWGEGEMYFTLRVRMDGMDHHGWFWAVWMDLLVIFWILELASVLRSFWNRRTWDGRGRWLIGAVPGIPKPCKECNKPVKTYQILSTGAGFWQLTGWLNLQILLKNKGIYNLIPTCSEFHPTFHKIWGNQVDIVVPMWGSDYNNPPKQIWWFM